ncbi:unnamed protein product [Sphagnum balticum]
MAASTILRSSRGAFRLRTLNPKISPRMQAPNLDVECEGDHRPRTTMCPPPTLPEGGMSAGWLGSQLSGFKLSQKHWGSVEKQLGARSSSAGCGWSLAGHLAACEAVCGPFFVDGRRISAMASMEERLVVGGGEEEGHLEREDSSDKHPETEDGTQIEKSDQEINSLFTPVQSFSQVTANDMLKYFTFSEDVLLKHFGEGLPRGLRKEFEVANQKSVLIRTRTMQLCNLLHFCIAEKLAFDLPPQYAISTRPRRKYILDGPVGSGKSVALATLVHWARVQGWLVFYIPSAKDWTQGSFYYRNEETGLVDTPVTAQTALEGFLKSHSELLDTLPCHILDPIPLGEGAGVPRARGLQQISLPERATLKHLVEKGLSMSHAGVGAVVRLRQELSLVKEVPVLIAIDDYNSWFIFSQYGVRAGKPIHAEKLAMVNAFRSMEGSAEMMVTAFCHSNAVGKLPVQLPSVPKGVRFEYPRYSPVEASTALQYYHSCKLTSKEPTEDELIRLYYLTNGNGNELRTLCRFL